MQKTLLNSVEIKGIGLHTGIETKLTLKPSLPNTGINFRRIDIKDDQKNLISANFKNVVSAKLCTKIGNSFGITVSTIEHLMGALYGEGIDNLIVEIDSPEVPIMDGSANSFVKAIRSTKTKEQNSSSKFIKVLKKVEIKNESKFISIEPFKNNLKIDFKLDYQNKLIGSQRDIFKISENDLEAIYNSRTFCLYEDVEKIKSSGLAKGGSLSNAIVVKDEKVLNEEGLRYEDEFVKHKILDCLGDLMLTGHRLLGSIVCVHGGHQLTNDLLQKFFSDKSNWTLVDQEKEYSEKQKKVYNYSRPIAVSA